jgi:protein involved in polysaccharide export with SLBB domain
MQRIDAAPNVATEMVSLMGRRWFIVLLALCATLMLACSGNRPPAPKNLPPPTPSTTVGPGDLFSISVVGEKELPSEYRVQPDGSINFPYVNKVMVAGLEPQEIVETLSNKLKEAGILRDPQISIIVKAYNSKKVNIIGQVTRPGNLAFSDGMKLVEALSLAGWFTPMADSNHILLTRQVSTSKTVTAVVSVDAITDGAQADIPLQAGDTIKVQQRLF